MAWSEWEETDLVLAGRILVAAGLAGASWIGLALALDGAGSAGMVATIPLVLAGPLLIALAVSAPVFRPSVLGITGVIAAYAGPVLFVLSRVRQSTADGEGSLALGVVLFALVFGSAGAALPLVAAVVTSLRRLARAPDDSSAVG